MMAISMLALLAQRRILSRRRYTSSLTNLPVRQRLTGWRNIAVHVFCHATVLIAMLPTLVVIYTSFLKMNGPVFIGGYGLESYGRILRTAPDAIINSFVFALAAVVLITDFSALIGYVIVRRETAASGAIDFLMMVPDLVPGAVMAIGFVTTFRTSCLDAMSVAALLILLHFIRRLPYGVRSTTSSLRQIKPSIEEAAINLSAPPLAAFLKVTVPLIVRGLVVRSLMGFITTVNELSGTLIIYNAGTITMQIYLAVLDGSSASPPRYRPCCSFAQASASTRCSGSPTIATPLSSRPTRCGSSFSTSRRIGTARGLVTMYRLWSPGSSSGSSTAPPLPAHNGRWHGRGPARSTDRFPRDGGPCR